MVKNNADNLSTLLTYPFEAGILPWPDPQQKTLIHNALYWPNSQRMGILEVVQSFYPDIAGWQQFQPTPDIKQGSLYQNVLCVLVKQKEACFYQIAQSLNHLEEDGLMIVVAANDAGGKRIEKWMQEFGLKTYNLSKSKCRIAWAYRKNVNQKIIDQKIMGGARQVVSIEGQNFTTQPGIFGWDKVDQGSKLLTRFVSEKLSGNGADFGCGYGFLSNFVLQKHPKINRFIAAEADYNALLCAQENLKNFSNVEFQWCDLTQKINLKIPLDFIVMNPPFHAGKKADSDIGQKFIENAAHALKKKGVLYIVANAHLPYEKTLNYLFTKVEKLTEEQGFKVYSAEK
jgi:16S rRNA (guanine1207-N2)-methyltransferase